MNRKIMAILSIILYLIILIAISGCSSTSHKNKIETVDELYEIMAKDCLDFSKKGKYVTTFDPDILSFDKLTEKIAEKDAVIGGSLYGITWQTKEKSGTYETTYFYKYYISKSQYNKVCKMAKDYAKEMVNFSEYEKIKATHDYLIEYNNYHIGSDGPYRALYKGQTNCNGYALAFFAIMRECGVACTYETGDDHAWNSVRLDNQWYNIDVTWDDTGVWDKDGGILYDYFLKSNNEWTGHHHGSATAETSYNADLSISKKLPNLDVRYTTRNIILIILLVVLIIVGNIVRKKIIKNKKSNFNIQILETCRGQSTSLQYNENDITLGR